VRSPLTDDLPFTDTVLLYNTDEPLAAEIAAAVPPEKLVSSLLNPPRPFASTPAARHYAIPSATRCVQCHMGSPDQVFNLGFTPLQINRHPAGSGGVIEDSGKDELSQLQRFISYGLITGLDSPKDVLPLEQSEGSRAPRNDYELTAQGYMLGNCAHCHNPRGYPSVQNPELATIFDVLPSPAGGVFQFPLQRYSPAVFRGLSGSSLIPFITPSLVDLPRYLTEAGGVGAIGSTPAADIFVQGSTATKALSVIYAPWRSIIYRNIDAAFAYVDDIAIFPHMPFNTPGYDPRAKQILGDWMVSIPSVRKHPELPEYSYYTGATSFLGGPKPDTSEQPYVEVPPGAPGYEAAVVAANQRLQIFHSGINPAVSLQSADEGGQVYSRYLDPGLTKDILDPAVTANPVCVPIPPHGDFPPYPFADHPHWVTTDLTHPPGDWAPRQPNWPQVLVEHQPQQDLQGCTSAAAGADQAFQDQLTAIQLLSNATLADVRGPDKTGFAMTPFPFGLMQPPANCQLPSTVKTLADFVGGGRDGGTESMNWMNVALSNGAPPNAPVYEELPGAAVFKMICINCHGPDLNSDGRLAFNLGVMTGGNAQVADWKDGLFGPANSPGDNIEKVFGTNAMSTVYGNVHNDLPDASAQDITADLALWKSQWTGPNDAGVSITADDRAARYVPWMGLGGTSVQIPQEILEVVAVTKVLGTSRVVPLASLSANMLSQAKALCENILGEQSGPFNYDRGGFLASPVRGNLLVENGDAELWMRLCALANPSPVHILTVDLKGELTVRSILGADGISITTSGPDNAASLVDASLWLSLAPSAPVGNDRGGLDPTLVVPTPNNLAPGATPSPNLWPWCIDNDKDFGGSAVPTELQAYICPAPVLQVAHNCGSTPPIQPAGGGSCFGTDQANQWAVHGAINAGMSVFLYAQSVVAAGHRDADYNECPSSSP
jgi:mono/diheme cytochrome c family protein